MQLTRHHDIQVLRSGTSGVAGAFTWQAMIMLRTFCLSRVAELCCAVVRRGPAGVTGGTVPRWASSQVQRACSGQCTTSRVHVQVLRAVAMQELTLIDDTRYTGRD